MTDQKPFRVETVVNAPLDTVWRAVTTPEQIREWFGYDYDGLDQEIRSGFVDEAELDPPDHIRFDDGSMIELTADGSHTIVRAVMPGPLADADWDEIYHRMAEGWRTYLEQIRFLLETRPHGRRRTLRLTGQTVGAEAVGLAPGGQPWYDSRRQHMSIDPDRHLVAVAAEHVLTSEEAGPATVIVTTYGLDDAAFARLRERWIARWNAVAKDPQAQIA